MPLVRITSTLKMTVFVLVVVVVIVCLLLTALLDWRCHLFFVFFCSQRLLLLREKHINHAIVPLPRVCFLLSSVDDDDDEKHRKHSRKHRESGAE